jgi:hypothetical protein
MPEQGYVYPLLVARFRYNTGIGRTVGSWTLINSLLLYTLPN